MRKYFLKCNKFITEIQKGLNGLPINNIWFVLDKSEFKLEFNDLKNINVDCIVDIQNILFKLDLDDWTIGSCNIKIDENREAESIEKLQTIYQSFVRKDIPDKAIVIIHDKIDNVNALCPTIAIWDAENSTIYDSTGERDYPYFDDDVEEIFKDEKPIWYQNIYKHLK